MGARPSADQFLKYQAHGQLFAGTSPYGARFTNSRRRRNCTDRFRRNEGSRSRCRSNPNRPNLPSLSRPNPPSLAATQRRARADAERSHDRDSAEALRLGDAPRLKCRSWENATSKRNAAIDANIAIADAHDASSRFVDNDAVSNIAAAASHAGFICRVYLLLSWHAPAPRLRLFQRIRHAAVRA